MEEKWVRNAKSRILWAKTRRWYRYQLSGTGTRMQWAIGTGTTTSSSPVLTYFCTVSLVFMHRLFRDPKK